MPIIRPSEFPDDTSFEEFETLETQTEGAGPTGETEKTNGTSIDLGFPVVVKDVLADDGEEKYFEARLQNDGAVSMVDFSSTETFRVDLLDFCRSYCTLQGRPVAREDFTIDPNESGSAQSKGLKSKPDDELQQRQSASALAAFFNRLSSLATSFSEKIRQHGTEHGAEKPPTITYKGDSQIAREIDQFRRRNHKEQVRTVDQDLEKASGAFAEIIKSPLTADVMDKWTNGDQTDDLRKKLNEELRENPAMDASITDLKEALTSLERNVPKAAEAAALIGEDINTAPDSYQDFMNFVSQSPESDFLDLGPDEEKARNLKKILHDISDRINDMIRSLLGKIGITWDSNQDSGMGM